MIIIEEAIYSPETLGLAYSWIKLGVDYLEEDIVKVKLPSGVVYTWNTLPLKIASSYNYNLLSGKERLFVDGILFGINYSLDKLGIESSISIEVIDFLFNEVTSNEALAFVTIKAIWKSLKKEGCPVFSSQEKLNDELFGEQDILRYQFPKSKYKPAVGRKGISNYLYDDEYKMFPKAFREKSIAKLEAQIDEYYFKYCN